jgi:hypothetical protein
MSPTQRTPRRRKLSVSIAEDLADYAAERAARDASSVSEVIGQGLITLRTRERRRLAAEAYVRDTDDSRVWAEAAAPLIWEVIEGEDAGW